jgi:hypothetical protein
MTWSWTSFFVGLFALPAILLPIAIFVGRFLRGGEGARVPARRKESFPASEHHSLPIRN